MFSRKLFQDIFEPSALIGHFPEHVQSVVTDSRADVKDSLFVALRGEHFDGHQFVEACFANGAALAMVEADAQIQLDEACHGLIRVDDTLLGLQDLARQYLQTLPGLRIGLTGSNGKTTTKELLAATLGYSAGAEHVLATKGNLNNHIGLPLTALTASADHKYLVLEMGMNHAGEISLLCDIARPQIALITNVGMAHAGNFDDIDAVGRAKGEIFAGLASEGIAVVNLDDERCVRAAEHLKPAQQITFGEQAASDVRINQVRVLGPMKLQLEVTYQNQTLLVELPCIGHHNAHNATGAVAVAVAAGVPFEQAVHGLTHTTWARGRLQFHETESGAWVIDDTYNANPDSMLAGLRTLNELGQQKRMVLIVGDMLELGDEAKKEHYQIGRAAVESGVGKIYACGHFSSDYKAGAIDSGLSANDFWECETSLEMAAFAAEQIKNGDVVLIKGSRGARMERVVERLMSWAE